MDLWIRAQDRTRIIKSKDIAIIPIIYNYGTKREMDSYKIVELNHQDRDCECLGVYKRKERALEVLDEIQDLFITKEPFKTEFTKDGLTMMNKQPSSVVYEMPEE